MSRESGKLYQDPMYGAKVLTPLAVAIIDTPEFQRLGGLRQLGFSDLVYRGALHTRLQHSIGTYLLCRTILRRVVQNHERLELAHPGSYLSTRFRQLPRDSGVPDSVTSHQAKWRGLCEVVSAAALLHDIGHVPFGHTLEDEFAGLYPRHDTLAGSRLHEMLFNESSSLARIFSDVSQPWLQRLSNQELRQLIYVILSWKEDIDTQCGFDGVLQRAMEESPENSSQKLRLQDLRTWHTAFVEEKLFHPFMSDIVGNTICADLLDYLPRDRQHLGMEPRLHGRLQRYLTVRPGTLYVDEGLRASIMVTRKGHGGQRRDVATAVLDIMRERYEMAERVYYHHKKASASSMLAKLVELVGPEGKPRDDSEIYPAPWDLSAGVPKVPHMVHLSDYELLDYLGTRTLKTPLDQLLQRRLHVALRYCRTRMYRTLLVVDAALVDASSHPVPFVTDRLRGSKEDPSSNQRIRLEESLAAAAGVNNGEVIIYCPSPSMQSKVVDARLEIKEGRVLPLRLQTESFAFRGDLEVLQRYYEELWRAYIFVSPDVFADPPKCKAVVDAFCQHFDIPVEHAYRKVRTHDFMSTHTTVVKQAYHAVANFIHALPVKGVPPNVIGDLLSRAADDDAVLGLLTSNADADERFSSLFQIAILQRLAAGDDKSKKFKATQVARIQQYCDTLHSGAKPYQVAAREGEADYQTFVARLLEAVFGAAGE
jgi:HD superfamily phosphohydrolase